jgi:hypothetical protein
VRSHANYKENNMPGKKNEGLVDTSDFPLERGRDSGSQSPQARRSSAQDFSKFGDRTVRDGITWKSVDDSGWSNKSRMHIEDENPKK